MQTSRVVFHWRLNVNRNLHIKVSHLCYATNSHTQYQVVVKLPGSFRPTTGSRHLHRHRIFTELVLETVPQSLRHSCTSELTRQGISLMYSYLYTPWTLSYPFSLYKEGGSRRWSLVNRVLDYTYISIWKVTCVSVYPI